MDSEIVDLRVLRPIVHHIVATPGYYKTPYRKSLALAAERYLGKEVNDVVLSTAESSFTQADAPDGATPEEIALMDTMQLIEVYHEILMSENVTDLPSVA